MERRDPLGVRLGLAGYPRPVPQPQPRLWTEHGWFAVFRTHLSSPCPYEVEADWCALANQTQIAASPFLYLLRQWMMPNAPVPIASFASRRLVASTLHSIQRSLTDHLASFPEQPVGARVFLSHHSPDEINALREIVQAQLAAHDELNALRDVVHAQQEALAKLRESFDAALDTALGEALRAREGAASTGAVTEAQTAARRRVLEELGDDGNVTPEREQEMLAMWRAAAAKS